MLRRDVRGIRVERCADVTSCDEEPVERSRLAGREVHDVSGHAFHDAKPLGVGGDVRLEHGRAVRAGDEAVALLVHHGAEPPRHARALAEDVAVASAVRGGPRALGERRRNRLDARVRPALVAVVEDAIGLHRQIVRSPLDADEIDGLAPDVVRDHGPHGAGGACFPCAFDVHRTVGGRGPRRGGGRAGRDTKRQADRPRAAARAVEHEVEPGLGPRRALTRCGSSAPRSTWSKRRPTRACRPPRAARAAVCRPWAQSTIAGASSDAPRGGNARQNRNSCVAAAAHAGFDAGSTALVPARHLHALSHESASSRTKDEP